MCGITVMLLSENGVSTCSLQRYVKDRYSKDSNDKYTLVLGLISNDMDFASYLADAKGKGIYTIYVAHNPDTLKHGAVKNASSTVVDWSRISGSRWAPSSSTSGSGGAPPGSGPNTFPPRSSAHGSDASPQMVYCTVRGCKSPPFKLPPGFKGHVGNAKCTIHRQMR